MARSKQLNVEQARRAAYDLLSRKAWSRAELTARLLRRGASEAVARQVDVAAMISRISPSTLYGETVQIVLNPLARVLGSALPEQTQGILLTPLALGQSLLLILPQLTTLIALVAVCFGISYIKFIDRKSVV